MERRKFIRNSTVFGLGIGLIPNTIWANGFDSEYSIAELMGKTPIRLAGEQGGQLRPEAFEAFQKMKKKAYQDGITLKIASGYRSFERQEAIWERKFISNTRDGMEPLEAIEKIIEYSTIPGTSRHHWGTDADIIDSSKPVKGDVLDPQKFEDGGPYADQKKWMDQHAESFGFHLVYTDNPRRRGFKYEPWHYTYAPLSKPMLKQYRNINILAEYKAEYFEGAEYFTGPFLKNYIQDHILDINPDLL